MRACAEPASGAVDACLGLAAHPRVSCQSREDLMDMHNGCADTHSVSSASRTFRHRPTTTGSICSHHHHLSLTHSLTHNSDDNMTSQALPKTMKAVVIKEPYKIVVEDVPAPKIEQPNDVIIKVKYAGLCGE